MFQPALTMPPARSTRRQVLRTIAVGLPITVAGCSQSEPSPPSPAEPTVTDTATPNTFTPTPRVLATPEELITSGPGIYPHPIRVTTDAERTVTIILTVERDGRTLYEEPHSIPPGDVERVIAGFTRETLPAAEQSVQVSVETSDGRSDTIDFDVNSCYFDIWIDIDESGAVRLTYAVC